MLTINEIFYSVQGESSYAGRPCVFVRLTACDLRCSWCDTPYAFHEGHKMSVDEVVAAVEAHGTALVEITGGEPLLQEDVYPLMDRLLAGGRTVMLETDAPHAAFLVTSEAYYPGWRARIDDREQPLVLTNAAFRGFEIPAGRHHIEMRFSPRIIWYGSAITFAGLIILAYVLLSAIIGRRRWIS